MCQLLLMEQWYHHMITDEFDKRISKWNCIDERLIREKLRENRKTGCRDREHRHLLYFTSSKMYYFIFKIHEIRRSIKINSILCLLLSRHLFWCSCHGLLVHNLCHSCLNFHHCYIKMKPKSSFNIHKIKIWSAIKALIIDWLEFFLS